MQNPIDKNIDDEIDYSELFRVLWAHKLFIAITAALGVFCGVYYVSNAEKEYSSVAVFKLDSGASSAFSLPAGLGPLARLGGISTSNQPDYLTAEKINGRIFIKAMNKKLNFEADPYYNTHTPYAVEPFWKSLIKSAIGWENPSVSEQEAIWQGIVSNFSDSVSFDEGSAGSVTLKVTHENALRAAEIANTIMDEMISNLRDQKRGEIEKKLSYLSSTLAEALSTMERSQSKLKEFALQNSALPMQSFSTLR